MRGMAAALCFIFSGEDSSACIPIGHMLRSAHRVCSYRTIHVQGTKNSEETAGSNGNTGTCASACESALGLELITLSGVQEQ